MEDQDVCGICLEVMPARISVASGCPDDRVKLLVCCGKWICASCAEQLIASEQAGRCPMCRQHVPSGGEERIALLRQNAESHGWAWAQHMLACAYHNGKGVERDLLEALRLYKLAADKGFGPSEVKG